MTWILDIGGTFSSHPQKKVVDWLIQNIFKTESMGRIELWLKKK
jgi:hypothetical protein